MSHPLVTRRSVILAELEALTATSPGGKPSYQIDGQSVDHTAYRLSLYQELELLNRLLAAELPAREELERGVT